MDYVHIVSAAMREVLDERGIELTWDDTDAAARAVIMSLDDVFEKAWQYDGLCD